MTIYYGNFSQMPVHFEPPRPGTMPNRGAIQALGLSDNELRDARRRSESIGHNPRASYGAMGAVAKSRKRKQPK